MAVMTPDDGKRPQAGPGIRIVLTGGPGSGKTTLLQAFAARGYRTFPEAGRAIIQEQLASGGDALPWADRASFAGGMLSHAITTFQTSAMYCGPVFLDRGIGDVAGYLELVREQITGVQFDELSARCRAAASACRYHPVVFIAPFWPEIYRNDAERRQDMAEAEATCAAMAAVWSRLGYQLSWLPKVPVAERVAFVLKHIEPAAGPVADFDGHTPSTPGEASAALEHVRMRMCQHLRVRTSDPDIGPQIEKPGGLERYTPACQA